MKNKLARHLFAILLCGVAVFLAGRVAGWAGQSDYAYFALKLIWGASFLSGIMGFVVLDVGEPSENEMFLGSTLIAAAAVMTAASFSSEAGVVLGDKEAKTS